MGDDIIKQARDYKSKFVPKSGFNLVSVDTFNAPGDADIALVKHFDDRGQAEQEKERLEKQAAAENDDFTRYYIYGADDAA